MVDVGSNGVGVCQVGVMTGQLGKGVKSAG